MNLSSNLIHGTTQTINPSTTQFDNVCGEPSFLLSRNQYDYRGRCVFELWVKGESSVHQLLIENERATCFALETDLSALKHVVERHNLRCEMNQLPLKTFQRQACIVIYSASLRDYQKLKRICQDEHIELLESDIKPVDRYLMERFINGSLTFSGNVTAYKNYQQLTNVKIKSAEFITALSHISVDIECDEKGALYSIGLYSDNLFSELGNKLSKSAEHKTIEYKKVLYNVAGIDAGAMSNVDDKHEFIEWCDSERDLLKRFVELIQILNPDLIIGWNFIKFDIRVLTEASKRLAVKLELGRDKSELRFIDGNRDGEQKYPDKVYVAGRTILDGIEVMKNATYSFPSFSLNYVAKQLLDDEKLIQESERFGKLEQIKHMYAHAPIQLAEYNLHDCKLVADIFKQENLTEFLQTRTQLTGLELERVGGSVAAFTNLYLPHVHRKGWVAPNLVSAEDYVHSPGGYVMNSIPGIHENVLVFDFKSLYPSIMRTFNIDPIALIEADTLSNDEIIAGFRGGRFSRQVSVLSNILDDLWAAREQAKANKNSVWSNAIKIIMNSFYGVLGSAGCRFYDTKLASSITMRGHWILQQSKLWFEQQGLQVIYGDTDSIFVSLANAEQWQSKEQILEVELNNWWNDKIENEFKLTSKLEIEFETHFSPFFMPTIRGADAGSKKRYAGMKLLNNGNKELVFKGLESVRSDWTELAKKFQTELFIRVFSKQECDSFIIKTLEELKLGKLDELLLYKKRIRRKLEHYVKTTPPHIKAARKANVSYNKQIYTKGSTIEYVISIKGPSVITDEHCQIDYQHYVERQLFPIAEAILLEYSPSSLNSFEQQLTLL